MSETLLEHPRTSGVAPEAAGVPRVSIVVSTCNRCANLPRLFDALERQSVLGVLPFELVLVDNRSTDQTAEVTKAFSERSRFEVKYVFEGKPGKSNGLNAGLAAARGELIAYTDDDGVPNEDWLERIVHHFDSDPDLHCMGGRVELFDPLDAPITILTSLEPKTYDLGNFMPTDLPIIGCNMAMRAKAVRKVGPYDTSLGPGTLVCKFGGGADDTDYLYRAMRAGYAVRYLPDVLVYHNHGRRSSEQIERLLIGYRIGLGAFYCKYFMSRDKDVARFAYWEARQMIRILFADRFRGPRAQNAWHVIRHRVIGVYRYLRYRD